MSPTLGYDFSQDVAKCVVQQKEGLFHREKSVVDQFKCYNAEQKSCFESNM